MQLELSRHEARERQRRLMQGLGRPIVSFENHGFRFVAIGKELRWSRAWRTFPDFLFDYIKFVLTPEWGNAELKKPEAERHPLMGWYKKVCEFQQAQLAGTTGKIRQAPMTGAVKAYLGLAYDLYLCAHNAELPELLVKRLRYAQSFEGAVYEAYVIGSMAKAGFRIEFEDETELDPFALRIHGYTSRDWEKILGRSQSRVVNEQARRSRRGPAPHSGKVVRCAAQTGRPRAHRLHRIEPGRNRRWSTGCRLGRSTLMPKSSKPKRTEPLCRPPTCS